MNITQIADTRSPSSDKFPPPQNSLEIQRSFFEIDASDSSILCRKNKLMIMELLKMLEKKGLLAPECLHDYVVIGEPIIGGQGKVYKVVEKKEYETHLNPNGTYYGGKFLALKNEEFFLMNELELRPRELELMSDPFHKSAMRAQKVFFEYDHKDLNHSINIIMPWVDDTLISWLLKQFNNKGKICDIKKNKRRFEEVRRMFRLILKGINAIHSRDNVHMDIKPENILVHEYWNEKSDEEEDYKPVLVSEPIIADFGMVKDLTRATISVGYTPEYAAPEVVAKKPIVSPKADIFSFGIILYKIFIHESLHAAENRNEIPEFQITKENVIKRIGILFPDDKHSIKESVIDDIVEIISISLSEDYKSRPQASTLLFEHEFFKVTHTELSKIYDFEIENTFEYAIKFLEGKYGYPRDWKKARQIFQLLSSIFNHMPSKFFYGCMVAFGIGGIYDFNLGGMIMKESADTAKYYFASHEDPFGLSEFALGSMACWGFGFENKDKSTALEWFLRSANKGNSFSSYCVGNIYEYGMQVEADYAEAFKWYKISAELGNSRGQFDYAYSYYNGRGAIEKPDFDESFKWFKLSAEQGDCWGQTRLGCAYLEGKGITQDKEKAFYWFSLADSQGHGDAPFFGAMLLEKGDGIPQDLEAAKQWYERAAARGGPHAEEAKNASKRLKML